MIDNTMNSSDSVPLAVFSEIVNFSKVTMGTVRPFQKM